MNGILDAIIMYLGWAGAIIYLIAYYLVSSGKLAADSLRYQSMCISSGLMLTAMCTSTGAWPSAFSNLIFVGIGLYIVITVKRVYVKQLLRQKFRQATTRRGSGGRLRPAFRTARRQDSRLPVA